MPTKVFLKNITLIVGCLLSYNLFAQKMVNISIDQQITPPLMGYNSDMSNTPKWSNIDFSNALNKLHPNTLRYPGGSNSLYWNWQKGWTLSFSELLPFIKKYDISLDEKVIENANTLRQLAKENRSKNSFWRQIHRYNAKTPRYNTIQEFSKGIAKTNSEAVFTLNVTTSYLEYELEMLKEAEKAGIEVKFIELGNEVYAQNLLTAKVYPGVDNYIDTCISWSEAIWEKFPNAHIGLVCGDRNRRTKHWNEKLSKAVKNYFPKSKHTQLHFILHYYSYFKHPKYDFNSTEDYRKLMAFPKMDLKLLLERTRWDKTLHFSTWVTEFNMIENKPYEINNRWVHGLLVSSQIDQLITQTNSEMFHYHSIGAETFPVFAALNLTDKDHNYLSPTSSGIVTSMWNRLTKNSSRFYSTKNNFQKWQITYSPKSTSLPNNPKIQTITEFNPIHAYVSYNTNDKAKLLVVNLSQQTVTINIDSIFSGGELTQYYNQPNDISYKSTTKHVSTSFEIPAYSINLIEE